MILGESLELLFLAGEGLRVTIFRMNLQKIYKKVCTDIRVTFIAETHVFRTILQIIYKRICRPKSHNYSRSSYIENNFKEFIKKYAETIVMIIAKVHILQTTLQKIQKVCRA